MVEKLGAVQSKTTPSWEEAYLSRNLHVQGFKAHPILPEV